MNGGHHGGCRSKPCSRSRPRAERSVAGSAADGATRYLPLAGRAFYSTIFIMAALKKAGSARSWAAMSVSVDGATW